MAEAFTIYRSIYEDIRQKIRNGIYRAGDKLPTVPELCECYSTSDVSIRKSIELLKEDGYVYSEKRIGIFIAGNKEIRTLMSFNEQANIKNKSDKVIILSVDSITSPFNELSKKKCIKLERMNYFGVLPVIYSIDYIFFNAKITSIYSKTHWINQVDLVLNSHYIKKSLTIELSDELEIKNKLFLLNNIAMFRVTIKYSDEDNQIQCIKNMYVSSSDIELKLEAF